MFGQMKQLMEMQKKMQEVKRQLDNTFFDIVSSDGAVRITMSASQELKSINIQPEVSSIDKNALEASLKEAYNKAIKRSHEIGAEKMRQVTGFNIPGLT